MTYEEAIGYLYDRLPVFHKIGARAYKPGLQTTIAFCNHLGDPQNSFPSVHIAGTNGKGSSSHMLAAVLQKSGYKVGLYTSPHLKSFTERIKIDGVPIAENFIADFVLDNRTYIETINPSFFEVTVAMAFKYFQENEVDIAVIEVGMGGRVDSTNVITPELSLITNISFDHMQQLGNTLPKIAFEKAGIIKEGVPVVISEEHDAEVMDVFDNVANAKNAKHNNAFSNVSVTELKQKNGKNTLLLNAKNTKLYDFSKEGLVMDLVGVYQQKNVLGVLTALEELSNLGWNKISESSIREGLGNVSQIAGFKGRWTVLNEGPFMVCDTAHNAAGLAMVLDQFRSINAANYHYILGFVGDKDVNKILDLLPKDSQYYFTQPGNMRALEVDKLAELALEKGLKGAKFANVNLAIEAALQNASPNDAIYVGGSTFVVADIDRL